MQRWQHPISIATSYMLLFYNIFCFVVLIWRCKSCRMKNTKILCFITILLYQFIKVCFYNMHFPSAPVKNQFSTWNPKLGWFKWRYAVFYKYYFGILLIVISAVIGSGRHSSHMIFKVKRKCYHVLNASYQ